MSKHSELDNTIVSFYDAHDGSGEIPNRLWRFAQMLSGQCCAVGHARRYLEDAMHADGWPCRVTMEDGEAVVTVPGYTPEEIKSWRVLRWNLVRGEDS